MRSTSIVNNAFWLVSGAATLASAEAPLATVYPCPSCPSSAAPPAITVTAQYQTVSTCTPHTVTASSYGSELYKVEPTCSTYPWVSTVIPCAGGSSTTVTKTDQIVELSYVSTVLTSEASYPTNAPSYNGTGYGYANASQPTTMIVDVTCPFNELGPLAIPGYAGSGLCTTCAEDKNGSKYQVVTVSKCIDKSCTTYPETWVSAKPTTPSSVSSAIYSTSTYLPSAGKYTIPVTTTCTPSGPDFTKPVTKTFSIYTSVSEAQTIHVTKTLTITYSGKPAPSASSSSSKLPLSTSTYCTKNGVHTIPIVATITPSNPAYSTAVTTTVYYTTTVTNAPVHIGCTKTVTVTFTSTPCPQTVVSGTTKSASGYPTAPAYVSASYTQSYPVTTAYNTLQTSTYATTSAPASYPTGSCEYSGCYGSPSGFKDFTLVESSGYMSVALCTSECIASGYPYSGLYADQCYCAHSLSSCTEAGGVCDIPCPGAALQHCGGNAITGAKKLQSKLFDVYECTVPTPTSTSSDATSYTTDPTPDPSSDPEPEAEKRNIQADMESSQNAARDAKLRRGGMLRNTEKKDVKNVMVKRDFGLKRPFGM
ncbi:hypothetical protein BKA65DRAFT_64872 [Rhexocercosporidium sp. MPI-PUGE-AT-0058]|nr:hypothetical protein BKA65DRAFT_64872 [Rhexocercosporidium sp. MPI-PUGE-AT-0058]